MKRNDDGELVPVCESHESFTPAEREACARSMPRGVQAQMTFLLMQYQGDPRVLAAILDVRRRTVGRHARGSALRLAGPCETGCAR